MSRTFSDCVFDALTGSPVSRKPTLLTALIGNKGSAVQVSVNAIDKLWRACGPRAEVKEALPIPATFGPAGHGKTHLCRQLADCLPLHLQKTHRIPHCVCLLVTFNQTTTWGTLKPDKDKNTVGAVAARCLLSLQKSPVLVDGPWPATFPEMLEDIRAAVKRFHKVDDCKSIAVCILLDEIMKVPCEQRRHILDEMTGAMQTDLSLFRPTFLLITSLDTKPVVDVLQTACNRPLAPVPLHGITQNDARHIADRIFNFLIACLATVVSKDDVAAARGCGAVWRWLLHYVDRAGPHFRSLETVVREALGSFCPPDIVLSRLAAEDRGVVEHFDFPPSRSSSPAECLSKWRTADAPFAVIFTDVHATKDHERQALGVFAALAIALPQTQFRCVGSDLEGPAPPAVEGESLVSPQGCERWSSDSEGWLSEADEEVSKLLNDHILFVRHRHPTKVFYFRPAVNLAIFSDSAAQVPVATERALSRLPASRKIFLDDAAAVVLLRELDLLLRSSGRESSFALEDVLPAALLLRGLCLAGRVGSLPRGAEGLYCDAVDEVEVIDDETFVPISSLLPHAVAGRDAADLWLRLPSKSKTFLMHPLSPHKAPTTVEAAQRVMQNAWEQAKPQPTFMYLRGTPATACIEGAFSCFVRRSAGEAGCGQPAVVATTVKLRPPASSGALKLAVEVTGSMSSLRASAGSSWPQSNSFVLVATCENETSVKCLPPNAVMMGLESWRALLSPLGASMLLSLVERKSSVQ
eukprot:TRINITY_DN1053_c0_g1_i1.p1 TRINITY_DN1053_c0_g1~~TRINITY_DN1053_c0_g1_i1.p1  ORF type:complete len:751 (+),score=75.36 TRINITY_DN1053_c0_g1_i1:77-2329(+)